jgi:glycosyltransferase involved in cell wall biosynthesis
VNVCLITKYPPIEGGVSRDCYWLARGLAEAGHRVFVVTNADEVEREHRVFLTLEDRVEGGMYAPVFPRSGGSVTVLSTRTPGRDLYFIPRNNPAVSRLATVATDVVQTHHCEVIFAYYLEPYGMAAHLASHWTGIPYIFRHAGSDLNQLMASPELATGYRHVLLAANRIVSSGAGADGVKSGGVPEARIAPTGWPILPADYFNPDAPLLDVDALLRVTVQDQLLETPWGPNREPMEAGVPALGLYGKLGVYKGSFNLLHAVADLVREGFPLYLLVMAHGRAEARFRARADQLGIAHSLRVLPYLPHWRVPEFIRSCTAVAFLERDFPIDVHGPQIPNEVFACGGCVLLSREAALKHPNAHRVRDRENAVIVDDPKRVFVLADLVRYALEDRDRAAAIGRRGFEELYADRRPAGGFDAIEALLAAVAREKPLAL